MKTHPEILATDETVSIVIQASKQSPNVGSRLGLAIDQTHARAAMLDSLDFVFCNPSLVVPQVPSSCRTKRAFRPALEFLPFDWNDL